jgi:hypothetical protein
MSYEVYFLSAETVMKYFLSLVCYSSYFQIICSPCIQNSPYSVRKFLNEAIVLYGICWDTKLKLILWREEPGKAEFEFILAEEPSRHPANIWFGKLMEK